MRIGLAGADSSHAEDFLRAFNRDRRYPVFQLTGICNAHPTRLEALRSDFRDLQPFQSTEALVAAVDAVVVCDRDGRAHAAHALPGLQAGKPVFVDKPLAGSLADAEVMVDTARGTGAALLSASALRWQPVVQALKARFESVGPPSRLLAYGTWEPESSHGGAIYYAIHTLEVAQELVGTDWENLSVSAGEVLAVRFRGGATEVHLELRPSREGVSKFGVSGEVAGSCFQQVIDLGDDYMLPVTDRVAEMFRTGQSPLNSEQLLAPIRLMEAIEACR